MAVNESVLSQEQPPENSIESSKTSMDSVGNSDVDASTTSNVNINSKRSLDSVTDQENSGKKIHRWDDFSIPIEVPDNLSKRQRKKYIRKVLWESVKPIRRAKEKEKLKQKKREARLNNQSLGPSRKALKHATMASSACKLRVALDFSFDDLMSEKDISKCLKQLNHCYCLNRRAANPLQLYVTNFSGASRDLLAKGTSYLNWDVNFHDQNYTELFDKEDLVYLTSDSDNVLTHLDNSKVYIIGALVDHNQHKLKTLTVADNQGISHAQLPIADYLQMNSRRVLTIDHVFEILIHASEGASWKDALLRVIPQRKGAVEKNIPEAVE